MIPLRDDVPSRGVPAMTVALIAANVLVFFHELALPGDAGAQAFFARYALTPDHLVHRGRAADFATIFTSMFLHGGWMHIIGNMLYLWIFGKSVEGAVGHLRFILFYLLCGVWAAAAQVGMSPDSTVPMLGASGAISGVLGAYLLLFPRSRVLLLIPLWIIVRFIEVRAVWVLLFWFVLQLFSGWASLSTAGGGGVAFWAHVGGFVAGMVLILPFKKRGVRLFR